MFNLGEGNARILIGTYTEPEESDSEGVYIYRMDLSSGELSFEAVVKHLPNVSFMAVHPRTGLIYTVNEMEELEGQPGGGVSVLSMDASGNSHVLHKQSSGGANPAYLSLDQTGRFVLVANYESGNVAMFPIQVDGQVSPASDVIQHSGSSVHPERQTGPHPHCIIPDPTNRFALVADLGLDRLLIYQMDLNTGKLQKHAEVDVPARSGPRHLLFNSTGQHLYLLNELNSTVIVYDYAAATGSLERLQTLSTLPELFAERNFCADIHFSPDEKHLYASNRGHDSIVCFRVDADSGKLTYRSHVPSHGHAPRIFALDPSGRFLIAVHQKSDNAVVFRVDTETGDLSYTGHEAQLSMPVHVLFV